MPGFLIAVGLLAFGVLVGRIGAGAPRPPQTAESAWTPRIGSLRAGCASGGLLREGPRCHWSGGGDNLMNPSAGLALD